MKTPNNSRRRRTVVFALPKVANEAVPVGMRWAATAAIPIACTLLPRRDGRCIGASGPAALVLGGLQRMTKIPRTHDIPNVGRQAASGAIRRPVFDSPRCLYSTCSGRHPLPDSLERDTYSMVRSVDQRYVRQQRQPNGTEDNYIKHDESERTAEVCMKSMEE